jgi:SAM-dependent methyltransferase
MTNDARKDAGGDPRGIDDSSVFWDERYRSADALWSGQPNPQLVTEVAGLTPGTALDAGCGEGADALWLAARGWQVTAVDISTVAVERGAAHARAIGMDVAQRITWLQADLTNWIPAAASYDLVSAQFLHLPREPREALFRRLAAAVASGGSLLIVGHHPSDLQTIPRPLSPDRFFTASDIAALLDPHGWDIVISTARERGATDPAGRPVIIHDAVVRARRGA